MQVIKRNGQVVDFDFSKIEKAISNAARSCGVTITSPLSENTFHWGEDPIPVEKIQDAVEKWLMKNEPEVAKEYILYREKHNETRFIKERIDYMDRYSNSSDNAATSSETDANANITMKNVANLEAEVYKTTNRIIQRQRMKDKLSQLYPEVAKQYEEDLNHHIIYAHDESSTPVPKQYCMAVSLYPLLEKGTSTMDGLQTTPPKGLDAFCGQIINLLFLLSSQCKGAVGMGELFNFMDHACVQEFGEDYDLNENEFADSEISKRRKTISQKIEQAFQNIVYSWNQSAGNRGAQSPFSNVNYFDKYYWQSLFGNFVFPDGTKPEWRRVSYLQKKFMKWFNKERTKTLLTFPVESLCLLNDGKDYLDTEYRDFAAEMWAEGHSFFLYTSDNADSVASCCFTGNTLLAYQFNGKFYKETFKQAYDKHKNDIIEVLTTIPGTDTCYYAKAQFSPIHKSNDLVRFILNKNYLLNVTPDHIFPVLRNEVFIDVEAKDLQVGDQICNITSGTDTITIIEPFCSQSSIDTYCLQMLDQNVPYFILPGGVVTHNCRLRNDVKLFSSTTGLTGIEVGSCNVITLNLNRIVQDWDRLPKKPDQDKFYSFKEYLENILDRVYKYHIAYKDILYDWESRGMMTASNAGYIHIKKLYSTFGINGINEAAEYFGYKVSNNDQYKKFVVDTLTIISDFIKAHNSPKYMLNLELVPAEELGIKNYNWDKEDGYKVPENRNLYNSYIYDAHDSGTSILDRFVLQGGEIAKAVSGGQAVHCNLDAHLSKAQYLKLMKFAVQQGTNYFTFNIPNTSCDKCGKIYKQPLTVCPNCGSDHMTQWTRVIGFLRPLTAFSQGRYIEAQKRIYSNGNKELND